MPNLTLLEHSRLQDPTGAVAQCIEAMVKKSELLDDMVWKEGNQDNGNLTTTRVGIPRPVWRKYYGGVPDAKSEYAQTLDTCGMMESYSNPDKALCELGGNPTAYRRRENDGIMQGFNDELQESLIYGSQKNTPAGITGIAPRFSSLSDPTAANILNAEGAGADNTSIYFIVWGDDNIFGVLPKGSEAGLKVTDRDIQTIQKSDGSGSYEALSTHFRWDAGLAVPDWRYIVRICNIQKSALVSNAASGANLPTLMYRAMRRVPDLHGRMAFYMSRDTLSMLGEQLTKGVEHSTLKMEEVGGKMVSKFQGAIPCRQVDALATDEAAVV